MRSTRCWQSLMPLTVMVAFLALAIVTARAIGIVGGEAAAVVMVMVMVMVVVNGMDMVKVMVKAIVKVMGKIMVKVMAKAIVNVRVIVIGLSL